MNNLPTFDNELQKNVDIVNKKVEKMYKEIELPDYDNSILKDMATEIVSSQEDIKSMLETIDKGNKKSDKISIATLIVAILSLVTAIIGIIIQCL